MYQAQLCIEVLLGEGRCTRSSEPPSMLVIFGREDLPGTTLYRGVFGGGKMYQKFRTFLYGGVMGREDLPGITLYRGAIWGGKMNQKFRTSLYVGVIWEGRFTRHYSVWWCYLGVGRCTRSSEPPCMLVLFGREDLPCRHNSVWWCYLGEGRCTRSSKPPCMLVLLGKGRFTSHCKVVLLGREDVSELSCVVVLLQIPLYGFVIWVGKMYQAQLCMVVLLRREDVQ